METVKTATELPIAFIDLAAQQRRLRRDLDSAIATVLDEGAYIMGPQVAQFEKELAAFCGAKHALGCANGTDAIQLALMALGVGPGDAVLVPSFTFAATAEVVALVGATPVFVDSATDTFNMDIASLERTLEHVEGRGIEPKVIMPVDLFGLPADYAKIQDIADARGLTVVCDSAQGFGGTIEGRMTGTFGKVTTTSFFPAKPLGCYGDGGAVFTDDDELAAVIRSLRVHGKGDHKYDNVRVGLNSRLDTLQAAILSVKLSVYAEEIAARDAVAQRYAAGLTQRVSIPRLPEGYGSVWAQYTVILPDDIDRDALQDRLKDRGVPTAVYYGKPLHLQTAYAGNPGDPDGLSTCERLGDRVLSLPMHPYLDESAQDRIVSAFNAVIDEIGRT